MILKVITGYKMYITETYTKPEYKGYSGTDFMEWTILDGAIAGLSTSALALAITILNF